MGESVVSRRQVLQLGLSAAGLGLISGSGVASAAPARQGRSGRLPRVGFVKQPPLSP